jgi:hypothetical protein
MGAGHFSVTGRFERLKDRALEYAFLLTSLGRDGAAPLAGSGDAGPEGGAYGGAAAEEAVVASSKS